MRVALFTDMLCSFNVFLKSYFAKKTSHAAHPSCKRIRGDTQRLRPAKSFCYIIFVWVKQDKPIFKLSELTHFLRARRIAEARERRRGGLLALRKDPPLYALVFSAIRLGCFTNCFPFLVPARLARVVAAYSAGDNALIAASGKYLSPVSLDFLPLLVRHFCLVQRSKDLCEAALAITYLLFSWLLYGLDQRSSLPSLHFS
tara:strand:- start:269 stop:871 length:603 start_codon:yes stop_codon:yes gene_type:complete